MMDCTDRHCRYFLRQLAPDVRLYSEMVTAVAIVRGDVHKLLDFNPEEHPVALQIAGSDPVTLARAARIGESFGYAEINLNLGCPSDRVQSGKFGVCLMTEPDHVADCVAAMCAAATLPISVKIRIGVDDQDSEESLASFVSKIATAGCRIFIVHARKALLRGLSPRENREIPPLRYDVVYRLKQNFPDLVVHINGGVTDCAAIATHLQHVDGVMLGRKAYEDPYFLTAIQSRFLPNATWRAPTRFEIVERMYRYAADQSPAVRLHHISRHMLGLYHGESGSRAWRRFLSEGAASRDRGPELLLQSLGAFGDPPTSVSQIQSNQVPGSVEASVS